MKKRVSMTINGAAYPCYPTMGAMLRYKDLTGKEVTEIKGGELSELCKYLWCCVVSASKREGKNFPLTLEDFADNVDLDMLRDWQASITAEAGEGDEEKKSL